MAVVEKLAWRRLPSEAVVFGIRRAYISAISTPHHREILMKHLAALLRQLQPPFEMSSQQSKEKHSDWKSPLMESVESFESLVASWALTKIKENVKPAINDGLIAFA